MTEEKCSITKADGFYKAITQMVVGKATTIKAEGDKYKGMTYYFNPSHSKKYGGKGQYWEMVQSKKNKIQKYLDSQAELPPPLNFGWINGPHTDPRTGKNWLSVNMPKHTAEAIDLKDRMEKEKEKEIEKLKIDQEIRNIEEGTQLELNFGEDGDELTSLVTMIEEPNLFERKNINEMSFPEYIEYKISLFNSLREQFETYRKATRDSLEKRENIKKFSKLIEDLEEEISELNEKNFDSVKKDIYKELDYMERVIDNLNIRSIEFSSVMERLETFCELFLKSTIGGANLGVIKKREFINLKELNLEPSFINEVTTRVHDLKEKYQDRQGKLIARIIDENASVKEHLASGTWTQKDIEDLKSYIDNQLDINQLKALMLGIHSGGGPMGQILGTFWEDNVYREESNTAGALAEIKKNVEELKLDEQIFVKKITTDSGEKISTGRVIHPYSKEYFGITNAISNLQKTFYNSKMGSEKREAYKAYMDARKDSQEVLDIRKIREFKTEYGSLPFADKVFIFSEREMEEYENKIKSEIGEETFDFIMREQRSLLTYYVSSLKSEIDEISFIRNSPFYFASHFESSSSSLPIVNRSNGHFYFPSSYYNVFFPKKEKESINTGRKTDSGFYDKDFKALFESKTAYERKKIYETWYNYQDLLQNEVNRTLKANGMNVHSLDIPLVDAHIAKEIIKSHNIAGRRKIGHVISSVFRLWKKTFYNAAYLRDPDRIGENEDKIFINYRNTVRQHADKIYKNLMNRSFERVKEAAIKEGIGSRDIGHLLEAVSPNSSAYKSIIYQEKARLARFIANKKVYSKASSNMFSTLEALVGITNLTKARMATTAFSRVVQSYMHLQVGKIRTETSNEKKIIKSTVPILESFIDTWIKTNIYGHALAAEKKGNWMYKISSRGRDSKKFKYYTHQEKEFKKLLKDSLKDVEDPNLEFEFKIEGVKYKRARDSKGVMRTERFENLDTPASSQAIETSEEDFKKAYKQYFYSSLEKTGIPITIGSFIQGILQIRALKSLALNAKSGATNREAGKVQNNIMAASGRLGFDEDSLDMARRMLSFYNTQRYLKAIPGLRKLSVFYKSKALQINTLDLLAKDFFKLLQDKKDQYARSEEYSHNKLSTVFSIMDFSINNAENHSQLEIVLAILAKIEIYDNKGNKHMFIENDKFTMYVPGTLEIKEEFREGIKMMLNESGDLVAVPTDNVRIWEKFQESNEEGKLNTHLHIFNKITRAIDRTQGNYNAKDIAKIFTSTVGKSLMLFKRYLPEQVNANFGTMNWDLASGKKKYEGRMKIIAKHTPLLFTHLLFSTAISTGFFLLIPIPILGTIFGIGGALSYFTYKFFKKSSSESLKLNADSILHMIDYTQEVLLRSIDLPFRMVSRGRHRTLHVTVNGENISLNTVALSKNISKKISPLTTEERKNVSESVQSTVESIKYLSATLILSLAVQALYLAFKGSDDDDDKDKEKLKIEALKKYEKTLNLVSNRAGMIVDEVNMYSNPYTFTDQVTQLMLVKDLSHAKGLIVDLYQYFTLDDELPEEGKVIKSIFNPIPIPNSATDMIFTPGTTFWGDAKKYDTDWTDVLFKPDKYLDDVKYKNLRKKEKKNVIKLTEKELKKRYPDWSKEDYEEEAKRIAEAMMKPGQKLGLRKINTEGTARYEPPGKFLEREEEYNIFEDEKILPEIKKRISGFKNDNNKKVMGALEHRAKRIQEEKREE